jgi:hypothetical protein
MSTKALVLRLPPDDFARLESEARRLGVRPGTAARILLRERLAEDEERRARGLRALAEIRALARGVGPLDAVSIIREGRDELEARGTRRP